MLTNLQTSEILLPDSHIGEKSGHKLRKESTCYNVAFSQVVNFNDVNVGLNKMKTDTVDVF